MNRLGDKDPETIEKYTHVRNIALSLDIGQLNLGLIALKFLRDIFIDPFGSSVPFRSSEKISFILALSGNPPKNVHNIW